MSDADGPQVVGAITLAAVLTAVSCSRVFVRQCLTGVGLGSLGDDAELVVSELVTNAVKATGVVGADPRWAELGDLALIELRLVVAKSLFVEVWDRDPRPPVAGDPMLGDESGRGMYIVGQLSVRWDCYFPDRGGKVVWAELEIGPEVTAAPFARQRVAPVGAQPLVSERDRSSWRWAAGVPPQP